MTQTIIIPSNPVDQKTILAAVKEANDSMIRISAEKEQIATILDDINDKFPDIGKATFKKLFTHYYKQNMEEAESKMSDIYALYSTIIKS